jgi:iron-sulfur cluster repair protein YtfE (RIC family)
MGDVVIATKQEDSVAAERVREHHAQMAGALGSLVQHVITAAQSGTVDDSRHTLVSWCRSELLPHAGAEETTLYSAARQLDAARLLIESMTGEHRVIAGLVDELESAADPVSVASAARALQVLFESHLGKENDLVLPALVAASSHSVAELLEGMHEILGADEHAHRGHEGHSTH